MSQPYSLAIRRKALRLLAKGERMTEIARITGASVKSIRRWRKEDAEGKKPNQVKVPSVPLDEAPGAIAMPMDLPLDEMLAKTLPAGSPDDVVRNIFMQKLALAMKDAAIPPPVKLSDWKTLLSIAEFGLNTKGKQAASKGKGRAAQHVRLEIISKAPRYAQPIDVEVEEKD